MEQQDQDQGYAVHETLELHEIISFKTLCLSKSKIMHALVSDSELSEIFKEDIKQSTKAIKDIQNLFSEEEQQ
ncbi:spore coat protein [Paenibacillus psychroresistens]|uniref:Spore coat protein n=1 Tax=Paenibacillus psychroresistens TaxID=1778678 RepID=A0A6B8RRD0_9BACL|nr:spore coat protein [Paenibacillus psychroresistens]QGQ98105.1 spore coat protein [Paenibacillus psychroresistens]